MIEGDAVSGNAIPRELHENRLDQQLTERAVE